jgi:hypothetical protein
MIIPVDARPASVSLAGKNDDFVTAWAVVGECDETRGMTDVTEAVRGQS